MRNRTESGATSAWSPVEQQQLQQPPPPHPSMIEEFRLRLRLGVGVEVEACSKLETPHNFTVLECVAQVTAGSFSR